MEKGWGLADDDEDDDDDDGDVGGACFGLTAGVLFG